MELFTVREMAAYLKTGRQQVRQMIRRGQLRAALAEWLEESLVEV